MGGNKKKGRKTSCCKACGRPVKGHEGPVGLMNCMYLLKDSNVAAPEQVGPVGPNIGESSPNAKSILDASFDSTCSKNSFVLQKSGASATPKTTGYIPYDVLAPISVCSTSHQNVIPQPGLMVTSVTTPIVAPGVLPSNFPPTTATGNEALAGAVSTLTEKLAMLQSEMSTLKLSQNAMSAVGHGGPSMVQGPTQGVFTASTPSQVFTGQLIPGLPPPPVPIYSVNPGTQVTMSGPSLAGPSMDYYHHGHTVMPLGSSVNMQHPMLPNVYLPGGNVGVPHSAWKHGIQTNMLSAQPYIPDIGGPIPGLLPTGHIQDFSQYSSVSGIQEKTVKSALTGDYCVLDDWLFNPIVPSDTITDIQSYVDSSGCIAYKPARRKRRITDMFSWLEAWFCYEQTMVMFHGIFVYDQMSRYRNKIMEFDKKYTWNAIAILDMRHRYDLGKKSVAFSCIDPGLRNNILDATAVKVAPRCPRCYSYDHVSVSQCPFPAGGAHQIQGPQKVAPKKSTGQVKEVSNEICNNFNLLRCVFSNCRRRHVCKACKGDLPYNLCIKDGPCSQSTNSTTTTTRYFKSST